MGSYLSVHEQHLHEKSHPDTNGADSAVLKKKPCKCNNHQIFDNTKITAQ